VSTQNRENRVLNHPSSRFILAALLFYAGLLALAAVLAAWTGHSLFYASPEQAAAGVDWRLDPLIGLVSALGVIAVSAWLTDTTRWGDALARALAEVLGPLSTRACLLLAVASGLGEEALFRGALQPLLGYVATSLLFGLVHFAPRRELLPWTGFAIVAGFGLGALYEATGNLVAPVVAHAGVNAVNLRLLTRRTFPTLLAARRSRRSPPPPPTAGRPPRR
jgi:membrane protease YdiL (CAAX protease family)